MRASLLTLLLVLPCLAMPADVFRWVDEQGRIHYGNVVPPEHEAAAKAVRSGVEATPEQRRDAEAQAARERGDLAAREAAQKGTSRPAPQQPASLQKPPAAPPSGNAACEAEWRAYRASESCFDRFKVVGGGVKPEAFGICRQLGRPTCNEPALPPSSARPVPAEPSNRTSTSPHY